MHIIFNTLVLLYPPLFPLFLSFHPSTPDIAYPLLLIPFAAFLPDFDLCCHHRKLLHNIFVPIPLAVLLLHYNLPITALMYTLSHMLHIAMDITVFGVAPLWPLSSKRIRSNMTNRRMELVALIIIIVLYVPLILYAYDIV